MIHKTLKCILIVYASFVSIWFITYLFFQDQWWGFVVLDKFAEYYVLPAVLFFLVALFLKNKLVVLATLVPVAVCIYFYASFFLPVSSPTLLPENDRFRVVTYNIWNHNEQIDEVVSVIKDTQADVIAIQEITEEQRQQLIAGLDTDFPHYHVSKPVYGGTTALFSKHPLRNVQEIDIDIDRPSIVADVFINDNSITLFSAHLNPSFWAYWRQPWAKIPGNYLQYIKDQNAQVRAIIAAHNERSESKATIIACDCNSQVTASTNRLLHKFFKETFRSIGWQLGDTGSDDLKYERKLTHIDYVWYRGETEPNAIYRWKHTVGSDHNPVVADFTL